MLVYRVGGQVNLRDVISLMMLKMIMVMMIIIIIIIIITMTIALYTSLIK